MKPESIETAVATVLTLRAHDELKAMEVLPDEASLLERVRRHSDEYRLIVQVARAFMLEVAG